MVRSGELPTRLLALKYGADLVWSPEIIDKKIITCKRVVNDKLNTIEYLDANNKIIFNTYKPLEQSKLIFQMGSANPEIAVEAGLKVIEDVDGIDLNCGCPKGFSVHAGMGAALLSTPNLLCDILKNLVTKVGEPNKKPISCKIRLMSNLNETLELIDKICQTGIKNLTVHCRTREMRNRQDPIHDYIPEIIKLTDKYNISFIINGNIGSYFDYLKLREKYGDKISGMIAESAESNPSIFSPNPLPWNKLILEFLTVCHKFDNHPANTKYILLNQLGTKSKYYPMFAKLKNNKDMLKLAYDLQKDEEEKFYNYLKYRHLQKDEMIKMEDYQRLLKEYEVKKVENNEEMEKLTDFDFSTLESTPQTSKATPKTNSTTTSNEDKENQYRKRKNQEPHTPAPKPTL